jgi:Zn-dependent metalloprotease
MMSRELLERQVRALRERDSSVAITYTADRNALALARGQLSEPFNAEELAESPFNCAAEFLREHPALLGGLDEEALISVRATTDRRGATHVLLQQLHGRAEVMGATLSLHFDEKGTVRMFKSSLALGIDLPKRGKIKAEQAAEIAVEHAGKDATWVKDHEPRLVVLAAKLVHRDKREQPYFLCWEVGISLGGAMPPTVEWLYYVDAIDGEVLQRTTTIQTGTGTGYYSTGTSLNTEASGSVYILRDAVTSSTWTPTTKPVIHTYDDANGGSLTLSSYATDDDDVWGDTVSANRWDSQRAEVDIHRFLGYVLDYYYLTHGQNSWDDAGDDAKGHAHNGYPGYMPNNAFWYGGTEQLYFGDGDGVDFDFMCPLDVMGHEFTHGVNYGFNIIQWYHVETGALNEALADIFGCFIALDYPTEVLDPWCHGDQCHLTGRGRNIPDPSRDTAGTVQYNATNNTTKWNSAMAGYYPDHYSIRYTGPDDSSHDNGGVHINAPIVTHALYLMVVGGTHRLSGVTVTGIGQDPIEQMLYYVMSTPGMLAYTSDFNDFRIAMITACMDLYPDDLDYLVTVKNGFHAVGIGPDLYARDSLADQGEEPGTLSCMSPDIICRQDLANATTLTQIANTTNGSLGQGIDLAKGDHHVYFRIFNRGAEDASGTFRLFISPVSTFPTPTSWHEVGHFDFPTVPAGGLWVPSTASECITLTSALASSLGTGHFCFIGIVEATTDPPPDRNLINNTTEFHDYIRKSNNYVWRNCDITGVAPAPSGITPALINGFQINGFGRKTEFRQLEVDARELPRGTRLVMWVPRRRFFGVKAVTVQPLTHAVLPRNVAGVLDPFPADLDPVHLVPAPLGRFARVRDALKIKPKEIPAKELALWHALEIKPGQVTRFRGMQLRAGETAQVHFVLQFPRDVGARDVTLVFRELFEDKLLGQMNYVYRVRNRKR